VRRVLVAGTQDAVDTARAVLGGEFELAAAYSVAEALKEVEGGVELVLCNVRFDDSRMFDFLGALDEGEFRRVPVVCFRMEGGSLPPAMERSVELALRELGIAAFVDLPALSRVLGAEAAVQALRARVLEGLARGLVGKGPALNGCERASKT